MALAWVGVAPDAAAVRGNRPSALDRLTIIGIDAGDWAAINYARGKGLMPNLDRLMRTGAVGALESIHPMFTPIVWTTVATGKSPQHHGIHGFKVINPRTGNKVPVNRSMRRVRALWNILSDRGLASLIVAWYGTWPAEKIRGVVVSDYTWNLKKGSQTRDFLEKKLGLRFRDQTYPPKIYDQVKRFFVDKNAESEHFEKRFDVAVADAPYALRHSYAKDLTYYKIFQNLRQRGDFRFSTLYLQGPDLLSHQYMRELSYLIRGKLKPGTEAYQKGQWIVQYYKFIDDILGVYEKNVRQPGETVLIVSDHGFEDKGKAVLTKVSDDRFAKRRYWHRKKGIFIANGRQVQRGVRVNGATVFDIAPTVLGFFKQPLARDMSGVCLREVAEACRSGDVRAVASYEPRKRPKKDQEYTSKIVRQLRSLGYIQ